MRPIPKKLRDQLADDIFMKSCVYESPDAPNHDCSGRIEWEHAWTYSGRQINEIWAIIGCCTAHNRSKAMDKDYNRYRSILRAKELNLWPEVKAKYPKVDWEQIFKHLSQKYGSHIAKSK